MARTAIASLLLAVLGASVQSSLFAKNALEPVRVTDAAPSTLIAGRTGDMIVRGKNFSGQDSLTVKVGSLVATNVTVITDELLCADFPVPVTGPIGTQSLTVIGGEDSSTLPDEISIIPIDPPGGIEPAYVNQVTEFARSVLHSDGTRLIQRMNLERNRRDIRAINAELTTLTSRIKSCTREVLQPAVDAGLGLRVERAVREIDTIADSLSEVGQLVVTEGNRGPSPAVVRRGQSTGFVFNAANATMFVDLGRGPIPVTFSGSRRLQVTAMSGTTANVRLTSSALATVPEIEDETVLTSFRVRDSGRSTGTLDLVTGALTMNYQLSFTPSTGGDSTTVMLSTSGVVAPIRNIRMALAMPNNPLVIIDKRYNSLEFAGGTLPASMPTLGGASFSLNWHLDKQPRIPRIPRFGRT